MPSQLAALDQVKSALIDLTFRFGPKVVVALLIMAAGYYVARWAGRVLDRWLGKLHLEPPVRLLLVRVARLLVLGLFLVMALQNLGVDLLPLIAGLGVAGAGIALAMQGVLGNLAAGLTIIFTRPFRVGEYVAMVGVEGRVESIDLFSTHLSHTDHSIVVVPNRKIVGEILHNYGDIRQLDLGVGIALAADLDRALAAIGEVVRSNPRVLQEPGAVIGVHALADASIGIAIRPWVRVADSVDATGEINKGIVDALRAARIEYPAPGRLINIAGH
jgi:small conductance mechanosensitive channel